MHPIKRLSAGLLLFMLLAASSSAQESLTPAPENLFRALVNGDSAAAALTYGLLADPVTALSHAEATSDPSPVLLRQKAGWAAGLRRWAVAQDSLEQLLSADSTSAWAHHQLGLLLAQNDKTAAIDHLQTAWELDEAYAEPELIATLTDNTDARALAYQVGTTLADLDYYALAERAFAESAIFAPSPAESFASVGLMRALQGLEYAPWMTQAQTLSPNSPEVYTLTGLTYRAAGYVFESLGAFIIALNLSPLDPEINAQVGEAYRLIGDERSATFWYGQANILSDSDPRYQQAYDAAQTALPPTQATPITP